MVTANPCNSCSNGKLIIYQQDLAKHRISTAKFDPFVAQLGTLMLSLPRVADVVGSRLSSKFSPGYHTTEAGKHITSRCSFCCMVFKNQHRYLLL